MATVVPPPSPLPSPPRQMATPASNTLVFRSVKSSLGSFSLKITEKLNDKNFLVWRQQVESYIIAHDLHHYLVVPLIPREFLSDRQINPVYRSWIQQDQMLLSWLQLRIIGVQLSAFLGI